MNSPTERPAVPEITTNTICWSRLSHGRARWVHCSGLTGAITALCDDCCEGWFENAVDRPTYQARWIESIDRWLSQRPSVTR